MEQIVDRRVLLSFDASTERTDKIVTVVRAIYATGGTPLYIIDDEGIMYNWLHIQSISPVINEGE